MSETRIQLPTALDLTQLSTLASNIGGASGVIVLEGASDSIFCTGLDVVSAAENSIEERQIGLEHFKQSVMGLLTSNSPSIALVSGDAIGGGLGLAAACDLVVAAPSARFGLPEPLFGLIPGMITPIIRTRISSPNLRRMAISGESIDADEAYRIGLIDVIVEATAFDSTVRTWCRKFARSYPPAVGRLKSWLAEMDDLEHAMEIGAAHLAELLTDDESRRRAERFAAGDIPWEEA